MSFLGSVLGGRRRRPPGRHAHNGPLAAQTILPGFAAPYAPAIDVALAPEMVPEMVPEMAPEIASEIAPVLDGAPLRDATEAGPRVGLFFGDGSHVLMGADDPRAGAFAAIADQLSR